MKILALGNTSAYGFGAFREIEKEVNKRGCEMVLFKQDKCLEGEYLSFSIEKGRSKYTVVVNNETYDISEFPSILYMNPLLPKALLDYNPIEHRQFIQRQFRAMREGIWLIFQKSRWVNDLVATEIAENKLFQLNIATRFFPIPDTVFTSDSEVVRAFFRRNKGLMVTKIIATSLIQDHVVYTNVVTEEHMKEIDSVKMSPAIFQSFVKKKYELRITVVGLRIFAARIFSQEDAETSIDWRKKPTGTDFEVKIEPVDLPIEIGERVISMMKSLNLRYGCIDMAVTPEGEYIFFEVNPSGQWYFVQLRTGMEIGRAIAELLLEPSRKGT